jgi:hypothetical protein
LTSVYKQVVVLTLQVGCEDELGTYLFSNNF